MATDIEIGDIVKKCKILLLDIEGTTTSISFVKENLFPYIEENVKDFLTNQWDTCDLKAVVGELRILSVKDKEGSVDGAVDIPGEDASKEDQIDGLVNNVKWQMSFDRKAGPLKHLQGLIWKQGYEKGVIKGHVFDDVQPALEAWRQSADDHKVYIFSSGSVQAQQLLFQQSTSGDLLKYIDGHFDTTVGPKQEPASYTAIVEKIGCKPDEILFLTDILKEAEAAREAGLHAALVSRAGNAPLPAGAAAFPLLHSLADLSHSKKRPRDIQEETPAAKILKTDNDKDVKSTPETDAETASEDTKDKMEVDPVVEENAAPLKEQVVVEELDSPEGSSAAAVIDAEPAAVELPSEDKDDKTEQKETEVTKETLENLKKDADKEDKEPKEAVVMEVEEVTEDKHIEETAEIIEDVVPVVEEPDSAEDMENLKNVGDVLEKECDEILSKVNDVTNLDSITVKPMLNPIAEETMETDNTDSNDIVDRILDTEIDLEMKQCEDIDPNTVTEMTDEAKTKVVEESGAKETSPTDAEEMITDEPVTNKEEKVTEIKEVAKIEEKVEQKEKDTEMDVLSEKVIEEVVDSTQEKPEDKKPVNAQTTEADNKELNEKNVAEEKNVEEAVIEKVKTTDVVKNEEAAPTQPEETPEVKEDNPADPALQDSKPETEEPQLNGSAANKDAKEVPVNGDASKELSARLADGAVQNGNVNGSNEDAAEKGQGDCKAEDVADIKVKSVPSDEPRSDPIEQPTQA